MLVVCALPGTSQQLRQQNDDVAASAGWWKPWKIMRVEMQMDTLMSLLKIHCYLEATNAG